LGCHQNRKPPDAREIIVHDPKTRVGGMSSPKVGATGNLTLTLRRPASPCLQGLMVHCLYLAVWCVCPSFPPCRWIYCPVPPPSNGDRTRPALTKNTNMHNPRFLVGNQAPRLSRVPPPTPAPPASTHPTPRHQVSRVCNTFDGANGGGGPSWRFCKTLVVPQFGFFSWPGPTC